MGRISVFFGIRSFLFVMLPKITASIPASVNLIPAKSICDAVSSEGTENNS